MWKNILLCCALIYLTSATDEDTKTVSTANGKIRGHRATTLFGQKPFYSFRGIRYGQPPVDDLRFKPPQPAQPWNDVFDAAKPGNQCIQMGGVGQEDCLFLNVYTKNVDPFFKKPVLINIVGGAFVFGTSDDDGPDFLLDQDDIVIVSVNYRMGAFGFLTLGTPEYPGNMGLKDQQLAIKWVIENIHHFGGDASKITLYGLSAGSAAVHHHVLSETSSKLFQRAILASGTALSPWALTTENHLERSKKFAAQNQLFTNDTSEIIWFLNNADPKLFFLPGSAMLPNDVLTGLTIQSSPWCPVVEPAGTVDPIITRNPSDVLKDGFRTHIDTLFGVTSQESLFFINSYMQNPSVLPSTIDQKWNVPFPVNSINENFDFNSERFQQIGAFIRYYYFGNQDINITTIHEYEKLLSDLRSNYGIDLAVRTHAKSTKSKTYYYRFSVNGALNMRKRSTVASAFNFTGATHADDSFYIYRYSSPPFMGIYAALPENSAERQTINRITKAYTTFVVTGKPTRDYLQVRKNSLNFVDYTNNGTVRGTDPFGERMEFWDNMLKQPIVLINN